MSQPITLAAEGSFMFHGDAETMAIAPPDVLKVVAPNGRMLLRIGQDGTVEGAVEDAGDAAVVFVSEIRRLIELGALGPHIVL